MTREYFGIFSLSELILAALSIALTVGALVWAFTSGNETRDWQFLMGGALLLTVLGQQMRRRRVERESGGEGSRR